MYKAIPKQILNIRFNKDIFKLFLKNQLIKGDFIKEFEQKFASYIGVKYAIATSSARISLYLILKALDLERGSEVILPNYTFHAVITAIKDAKLKPVFVDIDKTFNMNPNLIEKVITKKTKVILVTHLFGQPCDLDKIIKIANKHNLIIIEDCAQALGAEYRNKKVGSFGLANYFSFSFKNIHTLDGGMITTNDKKLAEKIRKLNNYPFPSNFIIIKKLFQLFLLKIFTNRIFFTIFTFPVLYINSFFSNKDLIYDLMKEPYSEKISPNFKKQFTNIQALFGLEQLKKLDLLNQKQIRNAKYLLRFVNKPRLELKNVKNTYYQFFITTKNKNEMYLKLLRKGMDTQKNYCQLCSKLIGDNKKYPISEKLAEEILHIPVYSKLDIKDMNYISKL